MSILADSVTGYLEHASWIRRMFEAGGQLKARYGADKVYDFSLGNPDLPAPPAVAEGLTAFAQHAREPFAFGYMPNGGYPWAREKLAAHLSQEQGVHITAEDVILGCGAAGMLNAFLRAVLNPGEEMLAFAPYFVEYGFYVANHGGVFKAVPSVKDTFAPDLDALEAAINEKTRVVLINSPHNPTGVVYKRKEVAAIADLLLNKSQEFGKPIWLVSDEPYRFLAYDGVEVPSVLPLYPTPWPSVPFPRASPCRANAWATPLFLPICPRKKKPSSWRALPSPTASSASSTRQWSASTSWPPPWAAR